MTDGRKEIEKGKTTKGDVIEVYIQCPGELNDREMRASLS